MLGDGGGEEFLLRAQPVLFGRAALVTACYPIRICEGRDLLLRRRVRRRLSYRYHCGRHGSGALDPFGGRRLMTGRDRTGYNSVILGYVLACHSVYDAFKRNLFLLILSDLRWPIH
jgi:hypothetical protein